MSSLECAQCGNAYEEKNSLKVRYQGEEYVFDSFECAIAKLAPECSHCGTNIIGHGIEQGSQFYCCERCARQS